MSGRRSNSSNTGKASDRERVLSQMLFREVNERMRWLHGELAHDGDLSIICECKNRGCVEALLLSTAAYDAIRRIPTRFVVKAGHETPGDERVAQACDGYVVAEKVGPSAIAAVRFDPRKRTAAADNGAVLEPTSNATTDG